MKQPPLNLLICVYLNQVSEAKINWKLSIEMLYINTFAMLNFKPKQCLSNEIGAEREIIINFQNNSIFLLFSFIINIPNKMLVCCVSI